MRASDVHWLDVAPATNPFEPAAVEPMLRALPDLSAAVVLRATRETFGDWAVFGFSSTRIDDIIDDPYGYDPGYTFEQLRDRLVQWRGFLETLARTWADVGHEPLRAAVERAAPRVLEAVQARAGDEGAWHGAFDAAIRWLVDTRVADPLVRARVGPLLDGRFPRWRPPERTDVAQVCGDLAAGLAEPADASAHDEVGAWTTIRQELPAVTARARQLGPDGHARYIAARDGEVAECMTAALALCRDAATHGMPPRLDLLCEWQAVVLGAAAPVEPRDALHLRARCIRACIEAGRDDEPAVTRAVRLYLDLRVLRPFADGNHRAARLALDHVLAREGLLLRDAAPIFDAPCGATDRSAAAALVRAVDRLAVRP